jgi:hypothetical protein
VKPETAKFLDKARELDPKYHRWLLDSFDLRAAGDYGLDASLNLDDAKRVLERAVDFRDAARALIFGSSKRG